MIVSLSMLAGYRMRHIGYLRSFFFTIVSSIGTMTFIAQANKKPDYHEYYKRDEFNSLLELSKQKPFLINMR